MARGEFRRDLFYRLNAMPLYLLASAGPARGHSAAGPVLHRPLRRPGVSQRITTISPRAMEMLARLFLARQRAATAQCHPACLRPGPRRLHSARRLARLARTPYSPSLSPGSPQTLAEVERQLILDTLRDLGGNRTAAALRLGVTVRTLQNKLKKYRARFARSD